MTRNLKALGLAVAAVFAMSAIAATTVQAKTTSFFTASAYPAAIQATTSQKIGESNEYFETIGRKLECEVAHFTGSLAGPSSSLTVTPDFTDHTDGGNCRAGGTLITTVTGDEQDCLTFTATTDGTNPDGSYKVGVDIVCDFVVHVRNLLNTADACTITVATGTAETDLRGENTAGGIVDISGEIHLKSTVHSNNTAICGVEAGKSKEETTHYNVVKAVSVNSAGKQISISD